MKIGEIRELMRLMDETSLTELHLEADDMKLSLKKATAVINADNIGLAAPTPAVVSAAVPSASQTAPAVTEQTAAPAQTEEKGIHYIKAPMVGTFYRAPAPDASPYVEKGQQVNSKTIVCIVEAMKLMNEIEAEVSGEVVDILVENAQLVEYGQPLFKIKLS